MKTIGLKLKKSYDCVFSTTCNVSFAYRGILTLVYSVFVFAFLSATSNGSVVDAAGDKPVDLISSVKLLINEVYTTIVALSSAAAGIGVGTGVFMKKFSMGKQDKIELGNKVVKDSIIGWFTINSLGFILRFLAGYGNTDLNNIKTP